MKNILILVLLTTTFASGQSMQDKAACAQAVRSYRTERAEFWKQVNLSVEAARIVGPNCYIRLWGEMNTAPQDRPVNLSFFSDEVIDVFTGEVIAHWDEYDTRKCFVDHTPCDTPADHPHFNGLLYEKFPEFAPRDQK